MYVYRTLTEKQKAGVIAHRKVQRLPWHAPPHFRQDDTLFLITAACFEHQPVVSDEVRLQSFHGKLIEGIRLQSWATVHAWVILPNHYHLLASLMLPSFRRWIARLHNGTSTEWNREDHRPCRKVWFRFTDRSIRDDRHYWATINYIHWNPVKHGWAKKADRWKWSSIHEYLGQYGRESMVDYWQKYPVRDYGKRWDD